MRASILACAVTLWTAAASAETVAIINARVETAGAAGTIDHGTVLIADGRIVAVGPGVSVPAHARVVDAAGRTVTPGLVAASSSLTVAEIEGVRATRDDRPGPLLSAGNDLRFSVDPASMSIGEARRTGLTRAIATPAPAEAGDGSDESDGSTDTAGTGKAQAIPHLFGGQAVAVRLDHGDADPVFAGPVAVTFDVGEAGASIAGSRAAVFVLAHEALEDARRYARHRATFDTQEIPSPYPRADLEALQPVIAGKLPLLIRAHRAADLRAVLRFAARERVRVVIEGAEEGWLVGKELAAAHVPVIVDPEADLPESFEAIGSRLDNAARLESAGVDVIIVGSRAMNNLRQARLNAGTAVAYGMPRDAALAAITARPARAFGLGDRIGSLEPGRDADVILWSGDPLEVDSAPVSIWIRGIEQPIDSRSIRLQERYLPLDAPAHDGR